MVKQKIKVQFSKEGMMRFVSHLDLMRLFQRASRRARLNVALTQGFSPHLAISIQPALKLGKSSRSLEAQFKINGWVDVNGFTKSLEQQLPEGITLLKSEII